MATFSEKFDRGDYPLLPDTDVCRMCAMFARLKGHAAFLAPKARREQDKITGHWHRVHIRIDHKPYRSQT